MDTIRPKKNRQWLNSELPYKLARVLLSSHVGRRHHMGRGAATKRMWATHHHGGSHHMRRRASHHRRSVGVDDEWARGNVTCWESTFALLEFFDFLLNERLREILLELAVVRTHGCFVLPPIIVRFAY